MEKVIRIGTRGSKLALWQAEFVQKELKEHGYTSELIIIKTKGDKIQNLSFDKIEGKGFFTKEIEEALVSGEIDLAIHSMKDLPTTSPPGLVIAGVSHREDPSDWLVIDREAFRSDQLFKLKHGAVVGTSSARRKAQFLQYRPDATLRDVRGNVPTRLRKLTEEPFDAIILAAAGLKRLEIDLSDFEIVPLNPKEFVSAPAQGVLAFQTVESNLEMRRIVKKIHHSEVAKVTNIERKILKLLEGGCQMPVGVYCERGPMGHFHVWAALADNWDSPVRQVNFSSSTSFGMAENVVAQLRSSQ